MFIIVLIFCDYGIISLKKNIFVIILVLILIIDKTIIGFYHFEILFIAI
jgi:hypothetical protein